MIDRSTETGEFWFDATCRILAGEAGAEPICREARARRGQGGTGQFAVAGPGTDVPLWLVTYIGTRRSATWRSGEQLQTMLPATID